jgi:hypothetical protein
MGKTTAHGGLAFTEQNGVYTQSEEFDFSKKHGLFVPSYDHFDIDHPTLAKVLRGGKKVLCGLLGVGAAAVPVLFAAPSVFSADNPNYDLFAGTLMFGPEDEIDNIVSVKHKENGSKLVLITDHTPWDENPEHNYSVAARSPLVSRVQVEGSLDYNNPSGDGAYTSLVKISPSPALSLITGLVGDKKGNGSFAGGKLSLDNLTINGDVWKHAGHTNAHGYVAGTIPIGDDQLYLSLGGNTKNSKVVGVGRWINERGSGIYTRTTFEKDEQSGQIIVVPNGGFGYTPSDCDFKSCVLNNSNMGGEVTDNTIIGWAPPAAFAVNPKDGNLVLEGNWLNDKEEIMGSAGIFLRPKKELFLGLTGKMSHDKTSSKVNPSLIFEVYSTIPGTPFEGQLQLEQNLRTGETNTMLYGGIVTSF